MIKLSKGKWNYYQIPSLLALSITVSLIASFGAEARDGNQGYKQYRHKQQRAHIAGKFDYYTTVLSWSPTHCVMGGFARRDQQCLSARPYAFILHGVWPQYKRGYPSSCRIKQKPWVSREVINSMLDIMPSKGLIIHEYKKHGTCSGLTPKGYYALSREFYNSIKIPPRYQNLVKPLLVSPKEMEDDFLRNNPHLTADMISIVCGRKRLREVRICFGRNGKPKNCGRNETQERLCRLPKMLMPPMRAPR